MQTTQHGLDRSDCDDSPKRASAISLHMPGLQLTGGRVAKDLLMPGFEFGPRAGKVRQHGVFPLLSCSQISCLIHCRRQSKHLKHDATRVIGQACFHRRAHKHSSPSGTTCHAGRWIWYNLAWSSSLFPKGAVASNTVLLQKASLFLRMSSFRSHMFRSRPFTVNRFVYRDII